MDPSNDTSPDDLMNHFRGRSLKSIVIFTLIVHAVVIIGTSIPFLMRSFGGGTSKLSEEERRDLAVKQATSSLREIAEQYGIQPQQLSDQLSGRRPAAPEAAEEPAAGEPDAQPAPEPEAPKNEIEKELEKAEPGPELPPVEEADDLFK